MEKKIVWNHNVLGFDRYFLRPCLFIPRNKIRLKRGRRTVILIRTVKPESIAAE
jgi:hypothetical protein